MIPIQELRVGNWVYEDKEKKSPMQVVAIGTDWVYLDFESNEGEVWDESPKDIEPIPITEEILLKCGFEKKEETSYNKYKINPYDGHVIEVAIYTSGIDVFVRYICGGCHLRSIKYLHELQNLVSVITNKELEIEL